MRERITVIVPGVQGHYPTWVTDKEEATFKYTVNGIYITFTSNGRIVGITLGSTTTVISEALKPNDFDQPIEEEA